MGSVSRDNQTGSVYSFLKVTIKIQLKLFLQVQTVIPSPKTLYPEFDWLIGNHSDELTPWIPLLAAQSSPKCNFFLLPCCFFDFWAKYQRKNSSNSQYTEYVEYIGSICKKCGFDVSYKIAHLGKNK